MKQSLTYHLTLFVIKLKGIKRNFSGNPIDCKKIRKEDVYQPRGSFFRKYARTFNVADSTITEIERNKSSDKILIFIHGGAFISGPAQHHWDSIKEIVKKTAHKVWLCDYPKAPENKIEKISENIDEIYAEALKAHKATNISIIGDSVGGTLTTALIQRLVSRNIGVPSKAILISPVMDSSMTNPKIEGIDKLDPMLSKKGILSAKKMCAGDKDLKDPMISPLYGSFENFPNTILFAGSYDIMYPDEKLAATKMKEANVSLEVIEGEQMPHIWPLLPVMKEAKEALNEIIRVLNE